MDNSSADTSQSVLDFGLLIYQYYTPLLFFFGLVGNSLSILVFVLDPKYRKKSPSYYLTALAISDTGFLINLLAVWLGTFNNGVITSAFTCPLVMYLGQVTCFVSVYLTVTFSVERYIAIFFPLRKLQLCTTSNARNVILGILAIALIAFSYVWFIAEVAEFEENGELNFICAVPSRYHKISEKANYFDTVFTLVIPFFVITFFNAQIAVKLYQNTTEHIRAPNGVSVRLETLIESKHIRTVNLPRVKQRGRDIIQVVYIPLALAGVKVRYHGSKYRNRYISRLSETRVTKTLLLVSVTFLCLNIPQHVLRCVQFIQLKAGTYDGIKVSLSFQPWAMILFNTNFAVNFFLYCMSGKNFRNSLRCIVTRLIHKVMCGK